MAPAYFCCIDAGGIYRYNKNHSGYLVSGGRGGIILAQTTKRALEESLKVLLLKKPLNKITISDITNEAGISRMTFYYHFQDIYELVEWSCTEDAKRVLQGKKTYATWQEGMLNIFEAVLENKPFVLNVYHSVSREKIEEYLYVLVYDLLYDVVAELSEGKEVPARDQESIAHFYKYAFVGVMLDWVKSGMKEPPKKLVQHFSQMIHGSMERSVRNFQKRK